MIHYVKSVRIRKYSGPHFPTFGLNTERYSVSLRIQSECWKMWTRITPNTKSFYAVIARLELIASRKRTTRPWPHAFFWPVLFIMRFIRAAKNTIGTSYYYNNAYVGIIFCPVSRHYLRFTVVHLIKKTK